MEAPTSPSSAPSSMHVQARTLVEALQSLDSVSCGFRHEQSVLADPPTCNVFVREKRMGCAHGENFILWKGIIACQRMGILSAERAAELHGVISGTYLPLLQLDMDAARSYEDSRIIKKETLRSQQEVIDRTVAVRDELLQCLRERFAV